MKMNFIKISAVLSFLFLLLFYTGCKKSKDDPFTSEYINMARESALCEAAFDDVLKVAENIMMNNNDARIATTGAPLGCITAIDSVVTGVNQKRYTATFNDSCTSYDGVIRKGTIIFDLKGSNYNSVGSMLVVTFQNYSFDSNRVSGKMVVNKTTSNAFTVKVSDTAGTGYAKISIFNPSDSTRITTQWKGSVTRKIIAGDGNNIILDNAYHITTPNSGMTGITSDNKYYTAKISIPLLVKYNCRAVGQLRYPMYGRVDYVEETVNYRSVDYGDDSTICDNVILLIFNDTNESENLY